MTSTTRQRSTTDRYLASMRARHLSQTTIRGRATVLRRIRAQLGTELAWATTADLEAWLERRSAEVGTVALCGEVSTLRCYYAWLVLTGARRDDPSRRIVAPRSPRRVPRPTHENDLALALASTTDPAMRAMLGLGGMAGLRACEVAGLEWAEVDLTGAWLTVARGKGGHSRTIPIPAALVEILSALPHRRGPVIRRLDGRSGPNLPHSISHRGNDYLHGIGVTSTFHQLRHRAGTVSYAATRDPLAVQQLLGHASQASTVGYIAVASSSVRAAADALGKVAS